MAVFSVVATRVKSPIYICQFRWSLRIQSDGAATKLTYRFVAVDISTALSVTNPCFLDNQRIQGLDSRGTKQS